MSDTLSEINVCIESPHHPEAIALIEELWFELGTMYGDVGPCRFRPEQIDHPQGAFVIAWSGGRAAGCGAIRPLDAGVAEVKRMFVRPEFRRQGVARAILRRLEEAARNLGYVALRLETGDVQPEAVALYRAEAFRSIPCYEEHAEDPRSLCFEKEIAG